jgi:hypothetical protein
VDGDDPTVLRDETPSASIGLPTAHLFDRQADPHTVLGQHELGTVQPEQLRAMVAEQPARLVVHVRDAAQEADDERGVSLTRVHARSSSRVESRGEPSRRRSASSGERSLPDDGARRVDRVLGNRLRYSSSGLNCATR